MPDVQVSLHTQGVDVCYSMSSAFLYSLGNPLLRKRARCHCVAAGWLFMLALNCFCRFTYTRNMPTGCTHISNLDPDILRERPPDHLPIQPGRWDGQKFPSSAFLRTVLLASWALVFDGFACVRACLLRRPRPASHPPRAFGTRELMDGMMMRAG